MTFIEFKKRTIRLLSILDKDYFSKIIETIRSVCPTASGLSDFHAQIFILSIIAEKLTVPYLCKANDKQKIVAALIFSIVLEKEIEESGLCPQGELIECLAVVSPKFIVKFIEQIGMDYDSRREADLSGKFWGADTPCKSCHKGRAVLALSFLNTIEKMNLAFQTFLNQYPQSEVEAHKSPLEFIEKFTIEDDDCYEVEPDCGTTCRKESKDEQSFFKEIKAYDSGKERYLVENEEVYQRLFTKDINTCIAFMLVGKTEVTLDHYNTFPDANKDFIDSRDRYLRCFKSRYPEETPYVCLFGTTLDYLWIIANFLTTPAILENCRIGVVSVGLNGPYDRTALDITCSNKDVSYPYKTSLAMESVLEPKPSVSSKFSKFGLVQKTVEASKQNCRFFIANTSNGVRMFQYKTSKTIDVASFAEHKTFKLI